MNPVLLVFLGGGAGAVARYMIGVGWGRSVGLAHPWMATMSINVLGGLLMGVLVGVLALRDWRLGDLSSKHALLRNGIGWGNMPVEFVQWDLDAGRLVQLTPDWHAAPLPIHLIYPPARFYPARLRRFIDIMKVAVPQAFGILPPG